jgi:hypothetical protein
MTWLPRPGDRAGGIDAPWQGIIGGWRLHNDAKAGRVCAYMYVCVWLCGCAVGMVTVPASGLTHRWVRSGWSMPGMISRGGASTWHWVMTNKHEVVPVRACLYQSV